MKRWLWLLFLCLPLVTSADDLLWHRTGPVAGTISRILADRGHPGVFYLLTNSHGYNYDQQLYRSADNGQSWKHVPLYAPQSVMVHSASSYLYVVRPGRDYYKWDLLVSKDQGRTFQLLCGHAPRLIFDHPTNPNILWGSGLSYSDYGLSVSYDGGAHWQGFTNLPYKYGKLYDVDGMKLGVDTYDLRSVLVSPFDPNTVYVSTDVEFYVACGGESISLDLTSTNNGKTWTWVESSSSYLYDPAVPDRAFSLTYGARGGVRVLTPAGWKWLSTPRVSDIVSVPGRPDLLNGMFGTKQYISRDGGSHWNRTNLGPGGNATLLTARTFPADTYLAGTSGGGLYVIDESRNAHQVTEGFSDARVFDVAMAPRSNAVYAVTTDSNSFLFRSMNSGKTWTDITDNLVRPPNDRSDPHLVVNPKNGRHVFLLVNDAAQVSFDAGESWRDVPQKPLIGVFFNADDSVAYFSKPGHNRLFQSTDGGLTLQELPAEFGGPHNTVRDLSADPFNGFLYVATDHGLFVSKDAGRTSEQIGTGISPDCLTCAGYKQILALPARGQYLAVGYRTIYKSVNQGVTWKEIASIGGTIYVADNKGQHLFLIGRDYYDTAGRLYESFDGGLTWDPKSATVDPRLAPGQYEQITEMTDPRYRPLFLSTSVGMFRADE